MRHLSTNALASQNAENTGEVWLTLLTISHSSLTQPIRVVNNNENITSNGELYVAWEFSLGLPGEDPENPSATRLTIGNIDPRIIKSLRAMATPPTVDIQVILASDPDLVELEFGGLVMRNATYDATQITGDLVFEEIMSEPVATTLTPVSFPGMF